MSNRTNLTKSLHTVSAVVNVALHIAELSPLNLKPAQLVDRALRVLGQPGPWPKDDPTVAKCAAQVAAKLEG